MVFRYGLIFGIGVPFVGFFRRSYMKYKFSRYNLVKSQSAELKLKESIAKFEIQMGVNVGYMVVISLKELKSQNEGEISKIDNENCRKVFSLIQQAEGTPQSRTIKWAFLGSKKLYQAIQFSRNKSSKIDIQFHQQQTKNRPQVYLIGKDQNDQERIMMEWNGIVDYQEITKYIAKLNFKKYLKEVSF